MTAGHQRGGPGAGVLASGPDWSASQSWARAFPGTAQQASAARRFLPALLHGSPLRDDAMVVLSELFTNAVVHTASGRPGGLVVVQVSRGRLGVRIAVTDQGSPDRPVIRGPGPAGDPPEQGLGLFLASQLADHLAWHDDVSGRTVCAVLGRLAPGHHPSMMSHMPGIL